MTWNFGRYILELLHQKRWTQLKLAQESGLSAAYINIIIKGVEKKTQRPPIISIDKLVAIAKALNIQPSVLLGVYMGVTADDTSAPFSKSGGNAKYDMMLKLLSERLQSTIPDPEERTLKLVEILAHLES